MSSEVERLTAGMREIQRVQEREEAVRPRYGWCVLCDRLRSTLSHWGHCYTCRKDGVTL